MAKPRPPIPQKIKREVRQRCAFGCVVCGLPLYEYEHIEGWAKVKRHVASEMILLCDRHHREKTNGLLTNEMVREANRNPYNKRTGISAPFGLHFAPGQAGVFCELEMGSILVTTPQIGEWGRMTAVAINGVEMLGFRFEQGQLLLNLQAYDKDENRVAWIERNELKYATTSWDIRLEGRRLSIRQAQKEFALAIIFEPPNRIHVERGSFFYQGRQVEITPHGVQIDTGWELRNLHYDGFTVALSLSDTAPDRCAFCFRAEKPSEAGST